MIACTEGIPYVSVRSQSNFSEPWAPGISAKQSISEGMGLGGSSYSSVTWAKVILEWVAEGCPIE